MQTACPCVAPPGPKADYGGVECTSVGFKSVQVACTVDRGDVGSNRLRPTRFAATPLFCTTGILAYEGSWHDVQVPRQLRCSGAVRSNLNARLFSTRSKLLVLYSWLNRMEGLEAARDFSCVGTGRISMTATIEPHAQPII